MKIAPSILQNRKKEKICDPFRAEISLEGSEGALAREKLSQKELL
jgi:hypothetical protein